MPKLGGGEPQKHRGTEWSRGEGRPGWGGAVPDPLLISPPVSLDQISEMGLSQWGFWGLWPHLPRGPHLHCCLHPCRDHHWQVPHVAEAWAGLD